MGSSRGQRTGLREKNGQCPWAGGIYTEVVRASLLDRLTFPEAGEELAR